MWCKNCNRETDNETCEFCENTTEQDMPLEVYWCEDCKTPILKLTNRVDKEICPVYGGKTTYMCADLRPVFPEERLLFEILTATPFAYANNTVWASNNRYYIDGKPKRLAASAYKKYPTEEVARLLEEHKPQNDYAFWNTTIGRFIEANKERLHYLIAEATEPTKQL